MLRNMTKKSQIYIKNIAIVIQIKFRGGSRHNLSSEVISRRRSTLYFGIPTPIGRTRTVNENEKNKIKKKIFKNSKTRKKIEKRQKWSGNMGDSFAQI